MASIFTKIIRGEIPCEKIHETETEIAFLDIAPCAPGHTLVVAKREVMRLEDLTETEAVQFMKTLKIVAAAVRHAYDGMDYNVVLNNGPGAGQEVPHLHFHIIPRPDRQPYSFKNRKAYQGDEMKKTGEKIRAHLQ